MITIYLLRRYKNIKRYSNRSLYADSNGGTCFLLLCVKAELCHGKVIVHVRTKYKSSNKMQLMPENIPNAEIYMKNSRASIRQG